MNILTEVAIILPHRRWITSDPAGKLLGIILGRLWHVAHLAIKLILSQYVGSLRMWTKYDASFDYYGKPSTT
jgi:hypothetical protein